MSMMPFPPKSDDNFPINKTPKWMINEYRDQHNERIEKFRKEEEKVVSIKKVQEESKMHVKKVEFDK